MPWICRNLRGQRVFIRTDANGRVETTADGRCDVVYKLSANAKVYRAAERNLQPTGDPDDERPREPAGREGEPTGERAEPRKPAASKSASSSLPATPPAGSIVIYTDGACTGNPGPMGSGAVVTDGDQRIEISEYLGIGTNNIAELTAIEQALAAVPEPQRDRPVYVHTDSSYSIGVLSKGWKAKANTELIERIRILVKKFPNLVFVKVRGHAGIPENERCDQLARDGITNR